MTTPTRIYNSAVPPLSASTHTTTRLFHLFYTTVFYLLYIALLGLILITPGDAIRQALQNKQLYNVFVIAAAYFVTAFLAVLIYASRIYTTRSVLAAIPRGYIPVEKGDVKEKVRRVVKRGLGRSAGVAWLARPRAQQCAEGTNALCLAEEIEERKEKYSEAQPKLAKRVLRRLLRKKTKPTWDGIKKPGSRRMSMQLTGNGDNVVPGLSLPAHPNAIDLKSAEDEEKEDHGTHIWGHISHPGWSPPTSHDLPNLHYHPVLTELPHLVEAKVVALSGPTEENLALLTRPASAGLREYLCALVELGCLDTEPIGNGLVDWEDNDDDEVDGEQERVRWKEWLADYEHARFSGEPVSEEEFRKLMSGFASLLRSVRGMDGQIQADEEEDASDWDEGEAYSVHSKSSKSTRSGASKQSSLHSKHSQQSFMTMDRRSILTTGTAGTVEKRDVEPQIPSYLSSPLSATYTPLPCTPSPRAPSNHLSHLSEAQSRYEGYEGYEMQDMTNTPESVIKRQLRHQPQEVTERIRLGVNGGMNQADNESLRSFRTESDAGSVIRKLPAETGHDVNREGLQVPSSVPLPSSRNTSSLGSYGN